MLKFDFRNPDYAAVMADRVRRLRRLRERPELIPALRDYYRAGNYVQFIKDWGTTYDPRMVELDRDPYMPFVLFPKQEEWCEFVLRKWREQRPGLTEKSRDSGVSWLSVALGCSIGLHADGVTIGYGSRNENYVDEAGNPKSLFWKARAFMRELPIEFRGGWSEACAPHMRMVFPETGSTFVGETGDNIGRGNRTSIYFVDEAAFLKSPNLVENSLSQTTNCRQDISTPNGMGNPFQQKRHGGRIEVFTFHWRDDPRKDEAWYARQKEDLDPVTVAQEIDIDYAASVEGIVIPHAWVLAAIDAHLKLKVDPTGAVEGALDVADEGADLNAFAGGKGILVSALAEWTGKGADIFDTAERAFSMCDEIGARRLRYDADGLGAGVRGDARILNEARQAVGVPTIEMAPFRGSEGVYDPEGVAEELEKRSRQDGPPRRNKDYFKNRKAQGWWWVRGLFRNTYRWVREGKPCDPDHIVSLPSTLPYLTKLVGELSQPTWKADNTGKIVIDKSPAGTKSPNLADAVMIRLTRLERPPMKISENLRRMAAAQSMRRR